MLHVIIDYTLYISSLHARRQPFNRLLSKRTEPFFVSIPLSPAGHLRFLRRSCLCSGPLLENRLAAAFRFVVEPFFLFSGCQRSIIAVTTAKKKKGMAGIRTLDLIHDLRLTP